MMTPTNPNNDFHNLSLLYTACDIKKTLASICGEEYPIENDKLKVNDETAEKANRIVLHFRYREQIPTKISSPFGTMALFASTQKEGYSKELIQNIHSTLSASAKGFTALRSFPNSQSWIVTEWKGQKLEPFKPVPSFISQQSADDTFKQMLHMRSIFDLTAQTKNLSLNSK